MYIKRSLAVIFAFLLITAMLSGCAPAYVNEKISIVCTVFPQYDWTYRILGNKANDYDVTLLLNNRIDLHNYQPSVSDIVNISTCDLFIYVGGASDGWVDEVIRDASNKDMKVLNLMEALGDKIKTNDIVEGMEHGHDDHDGNDDHDDHDDHEDHADNDDHDDHEGEYDEHVWLSLKNAQVFCTAIADALSTLDEKNAEEYISNLTAFNNELSALDEQFQAAVNAASFNTLLFADRFPFRYLMDDYGIGYYAAFSGCAAETEASFATIVFLAQRMDELKLPCVMVTESSDHSIARTVIENTVAKDYKICVLDAMQSVSSGDVQNGTTYLSIMESNLNVLKEALD